MVSHLMPSNSFFLIERYNMIIAAVAPPSVQTAERNSASGQESIALSSVCFSSEREGEVRLPFLNVMVAIEFSRLFLFHDYLNTHSFSVAVVEKYDVRSCMLFLYRIKQSQKM